MVIKIATDVLIIGGGTAGCFAAHILGKISDYKVFIAEKANIQRSGCLAAGVNALNAYITEGHEPQFYVDYAKKDADGIVRDDLLLSMSKRLNHVTDILEKLGLVILKDQNGKYVTRGNRNIKINGENIKPILAKAARDNPNVTVQNHLNITDLKIVSDGSEHQTGQAVGAVGFDVNSGDYFDIDARVVLIATGGASGLYRPNNPGFSRHKMWYSPFNTGAGFAMGLRAGAEMTTFEMRFIALRCKDTIAPTGTIAQGVGAKQVNSLGEIYEHLYGLTTSQRLYGTVSENKAGRGPCYLKTDTISEEQESDLYKAYLNMAPSQTLKWLEKGTGPKQENVEIEGTEPYIVGGHTASGYWIDDHRATTVKGLYAAGDVAGGCPQKYVTGALAEAEISAESIVSFLKQQKQSEFSSLWNDENLKAGTEKILKEYEKFSANEEGLFSVESLEEAMQKIMDQYAGGICTGYSFNSYGLSLAKQKIATLEPLLGSLKAKDADDLLHIYELKERLLVCRVLIAHLEARHETRWHCFAENTDYPQKSKDWECYVNSKLENNEVKIIIRDLVKPGEVYEHTY